MTRYFRFLIAFALFTTSCNNDKKTNNETSQISEITMDTSAPQIKLPDTSRTNQTYVAPDTSQQIYCDFIKGRRNVVGKSNEDEKSFKESVTFECVNSKVVMKTSLVSYMARQGEAVGNVYSLRSKNVMGDVYSISLEREKNGMKGYLKQSFSSGNTSYYFLKLSKSKK